VSKDDDEGEEEPRLKYQRLGWSLLAILSTDAAAAVVVTDRMVALCTHSGVMYFLHS
jgi:vacuolar protein sorting-associated protein 41